MKIREVLVTLRILEPTRPENWLKKTAHVPRKYVYLGAEASPDDWQEITPAEYEALTAAEPESEE